VNTGCRRRTGPALECPRGPGLGCERWWWWAAGRYPRVILVPAGASAPAFHSGWWMVPTTAIRRCPGPFAARAATSGRRLGPLAPALSSVGCRSSRQDKSTTRGGVGNVHSRHQQRV